MLRTVSLLSVAAISALSLSHRPAPAALAACPNTWVHEPLLVHDVGGSTLAGPFYRHLAVYSSGFATISSSIGFLADNGASQTAFASPAEVQTLRNDLSNAGAFTACDDPTMAADLPLTTVTVFRGGTNSAAHTFSFMIPDGQTAAVQAIVDSFIAAHFPSF